MLKRWFPRLFTGANHTKSPSAYIGAETGNHCYALRTIGGSTNRNNKELNTRGSHIHRSRVRRSLAASEEEIMDKGGITKTTKVEVLFGDEAWTDEEVDCTLGDAASRFHFNESVRTIVHPPSRGPSQV